MTHQVDKKVADGLLRLILLKGPLGAVFLLGNTTGKHLMKPFMHSATTDPS